MARKLTSKDRPAKDTPQKEDSTKSSLDVDTVIRRGATVVGFLRHENLDHFAEAVESLISIVKRGASK